MQSISELKSLLANLRPELKPGTFAFVAVPDGVKLDSNVVVASIREPEGLSVIIPEQVALDLGLPIAFSAAWITLTVHSDLAAVGLTAAFSQALAQAGISCNAVAGVYHDHVFVPKELSLQAMAVLSELSSSTGRPFTSE